MENRVLRALKSRTKSLCFDLGGLAELPTAIGRLDFLQSLSAKNNCLRTLPQEISNLGEVCVHESVCVRERASNTYDLKYMMSCSPYSCGTSTWDAMRYKSFLNVC